MGLETGFRQNAWGVLELLMQLRVGLTINQMEAGPLYSHTLSEHNLLCGSAPVQTGNSPEKRKPGATKEPCGAGSPNWYGGSTE